MKYTVYILCIYGLYIPTCTSRIRSTKISSSSDWLFYPTFISTFKLTFSLFKMKFLNLQFWRSNWRFSTQKLTGATIKLSFVTFKFNIIDVYVSTFLLLFSTFRLMFSTFWLLFSTFKLTEHSLHFDLQLWKFNLIASGQKMWFYQPEMTSNESKINFPDLEIILWFKNYFFKFQSTIKVTTKTVLVKFGSLNE